MSNLGMNLKLDRVLIEESTGRIIVVHPDGSHQSAAPADCSSLVQHEAFKVVSRILEDEFHASERMIRADIYNETHQTLYNGSMPSGFDPATSTHGFLGHRRGFNPSRLLDEESWVRFDETK